MKPVWKDTPRDDKIATIRRLVDQNYTASQIARHFEGATKNAVIALMHKAGHVRHPKTRLVP